MSMALTGHDTQHGGDGARCGLATRRWGQRPEIGARQRRGERLLPSPAARGKAEPPTGQVPTPLIREEAWGGAEERDTARGNRSDVRPRAAPRSEVQRSPGVCASARTRGANSQRLAEKLRAGTFQKYPVQQSKTASEKLYRTNTRHTAQWPCPAPWGQQCHRGFGFTASNLAAIFSDNLIAKSPTKI